MSDPVRVDLTKTSLTRNLAGFDLGDATYETMVAGAGAGVIWPYASTDLVVLKNDSGETATYTIQLSTPASYVALGLAPDNPTIELADGELYLVRVSELWRDNTRKCAIDCDQAGKILVLDMPA
jgi:hypothetical protein